jgi:hypothetical protein
MVLLTDTPLELELEPLLPHATSAELEIRMAAQLRIQRAPTDLKDICRPLSYQLNSGGPWSQTKLRFHRPKYR